MTTYKELLAKRDALNLAIEQARQNEAATAIAEARELVATFGLSVTDIFPVRGGTKVQSNPSGKVAAKYRDPISGKTWSGRGMEPRWMQGQERQQFLIA